MLSASGYATPGNTLTISGMYFIPNGVATLYDGSTQIATVPVKQLLSVVGLYVGGFQITYTIPYETATGAHTLQAVEQEQSGNLTASTAFTVAASWAQFGFSPTNTRLNTYETAISPANVSTLKVAWTYASNFGFIAPVVVNGDIYFANNNGSIFAKNAATGAPVWASTPGGNFGIAGSQAPGLYDGTLFVGSFASIYAANANSGKQAWASIGQVSADPVYLAEGLVYADDSGMLAAYNPVGCASGSCAPNWTLSFLSQGIGIGSNMVASGNTYLVAGGYTATGNGGIFAVDAASHKILWSGAITTSDRYDGSIVADGGYVFIAYATSNSTIPSTLYAFSASGCGQSTCQPLWTASISQMGSYANATGLAVANNTIFVGGAGLYAFPEGGCGASTCSPSWIGQTSEPGQTANLMIDSAPAVANGLVYAGAEDGTVRAFNANGCGAASCPPVWNYCTAGSCTPSTAEHFGSPVVLNGMVYIASYGGTLYAFKLSGATASPPRGMVSPTHAKPARASSRQWARPSIVAPECRPLIW
ncbi:MAG TPA: PQQ-binding-like beta-propeller repeat protein [Ktedonobacterales bacterium]